MSSPGYAAALVVEPRPSRGLAALSAVALGAAMLAAAAFLPLALAVPACVFGLGCSFAESARQSAGGRLEWRADGSWRVATPGGVRRATLGAGSVSTRWLVVLALRTEAGTLRRVLPRDALPPETWRRLRVRLRIQGGATAEPTAPYPGA